jgi:NADP-dependent 3-hydroxy acid dehydrogenase YdfG
MGKLDGKVALITGAGTGIGRSTAIMFAAEGAELVIAGRRQAPLDEVVSEITSAGGKVTAKSADMEDQASVEALAAYALEKHGRVDILINNAGHSSKVRSVRWISREEFDSVYAVNVAGPSQLTKMLLPPMLEYGAGTVILVSSVAALRSGLLGGIAYGPAKAAAKLYMDNLRGELRQQGIRATTIYPAEVDTPILNNRPLVPDAEARSTMMHPEDIAAGILFAATLPARTMIDDMTFTPTVQRDTTEEVAVARSAGAPDGAV